MRLRRVTIPLMMALTAISVASWLNFSWKRNSEIRRKILEEFLRIKITNGFPDLAVGESGF